MTVKRNRPQTTFFLHDARDNPMDALDNSCVKGPIFGAQTQAAAHNTFVFRPRKAREEANLLRSSPIHPGQAAGRESPHQRKAKRGNFDAQSVVLCSVFLCLEFERRNDDRSLRRQSTTSLETIRIRLQAVLLFPQANALEQPKRLLSPLCFRSCLNHEIAFPIINNKELNMLDVLYLGRFLSLIHANCFA